MMTIMIYVIPHQLQSVRLITQHYIMIMIGHICYINTYLLPKVLQITIVSS